MMKKSNTQAAFFSRRTLFGFAISLTGLSMAFIGFAANPAASTQARPATAISQRPGSPEVHRIVGPVSLNRDLRTLRYIPQSGESEEDVRLTRHPRHLGGAPEKFNLVKAVRQAMLPSTMPTPVATYAGIGQANSGCACLPPDPNGDVGPNQYIQAVNVSFTILDKNGNTLVGPTTYNSLFSLMGATPCGLNQNQGDPVAFYDHMADRWVISDFAFPSFPGTSFYQCVAVSKTSDPVSGGWWLYAVQVDPAKPTFLGDYPKFGLWPDAYYFAVNQFSNNTTFNGFRVFALDRNSMINGGPANTVAFSVDAANAGDTYSLVPATFRTGSPPPAGRDEFFLSVDSPASGGVTLTQVHAWKFHVDFVNPANSTFGIGPNHQPNAHMTVNGFIDAFTNTTSNLTPQPGTTAQLDTLGDKIMYPLVYQNLNGVESLWADQTVMLNYPNGPTAVRWYQFDVTGGNLPATPVQQQDWTNGGDGLFRWMPSIALDVQGNMVIGYSASSSAISPSIRYAGRLATDPLNNLGQGEAIMINGGGSQTSGSGRWGDYSMTAVDPADGMTFWHTHEYYTATSSSTWATRIGKFRFAQPLTLSSAVSRKNHNAAGTFDISLPGIECRTGDYSIVVTFSNNVVNGNAAVTNGVGTVFGPPVFSGNTMTINLTGVANVQTLTVTLINVMDAFGQTLPDSGVTMSVLIGDTNGNNTVNAADVAQAKAQLGQAVTGSNFRTDVNANGTINAADAALVKQHSGESLP